MALSPPTNGVAPHSNGTFHGVSLSALPKSNTFTSHLPADSKFPIPTDSYNATRKELGPRMVKNALFTYVRPEEKEGAELYGVSYQAMKDIGLAPGEEETEEFQKLVAGNKIFWDPNTKEGIYPWAQCYGGWQFGSWAGQLGDGRAISLFESTNSQTKARYELQLKGAGITPYSRFADGKAVVRSSVREFIVSEALNGLSIPTTRALSLTLTRNTTVIRERIEPGAIVCRFAPSWLRIGTFDLLRARGDRSTLRHLSTYFLTHVFSSPLPLPSNSLPQPPPTFSPSDSSVRLEEPLHLNRFAQLYRHIALLNAKTVALWQAYGFINGVLNTDNTSLLGLSLDFGPFAFLDNFDPNYTPNHDDGMLRYSYRNQPSIIWWNLVRLGEDLGELIGAGARVDEEEFVEKGVSEAWAPELIARAEKIIAGVGAEYQEVFLAEYKQRMAARVGLKSVKDGDFETVYSKLLDTMEELELDFNHFFRRLSYLSVGDIDTESKRRAKAGVFFHKEGVSALGVSEEKAREKLAAWLAVWRERVLEDWGSEDPEAADRAVESGWDEERMKGMRQRVNPRFVPRGWVLDEIIARVEREGDKGVLKRVMRMVERPFEVSVVGHQGTEIDGNEEGKGMSVEEQKREEERWCGDVPREMRGGMCSCSS